ncbi:MAG: hypothetical protein FWB93_05370, partial [Oscillospiraceae bacterium]|nr:hypothetical protein [Oscillospiraceae bacterium]
MKKLALLLALLMMLTVGLFAFTGCGNGNDEPSHDYDNLDDLLDAIYDEANSNLTGNDVMNANMREDEFFYINEYNVRNTTGLTWDRFQTVQEHSYRTNLVMNVANRMTLFRVNGNASEIANWIEADYYSRWNVCAWPDRSFVMYAGDYVLVFSGTTAQATAMQNAFREVLGVQGRLSEF